MKNIEIKNTNKGAAMMVLVLFFVLISLTILIGIVTPTVREFNMISQNFKSRETYFLAESGVEDVLYRLKHSKQTNSTELLVLGNGETTTTVRDVSVNQKEIISLGDTNSLQRKIKTILETGVGASFNYGVQIGMGGFTMNNGSKIIGSVYSNGNISGSGEITGSATAANSPALEADQTNGSGTPTYNIAFGNTSSTGDFSQSFRINDTGVLNKVSLYIKKVSTPSNITVRVTTDSSGKPSTTTLTQGTLSASSVSTNYGWVDVPFDTNIQISGNTTYWIVLDSSVSSTKYFIMGANENGYSNGVSKIGTYSGTWNNTTPSGADAFFNVYLGGITGEISGITVGEGTVGNAYAHSINNATIRGTAYCKAGSGNNKSCDTSREDPVQLAMPISEQNILDWKDEATIGGTYNGTLNVSSNISLGPKKITGDLVISNSKIVTLNGIVWIQGNLVLSNGSKFKLNPSFGSSGTVIIVDGTITISNNSTFEGSGTPGSYIMALSTSSSSNAINLSNNGGAVILYASNGTINVSNNATAVSLTGYNIHLNNNAVITYDQGLANTNFSSGPGGTWNVNSWQEVE